MRLALIIDDYLPESTRVGAKMMHELATCLKQNGHEIIVITPSPGQKELLVQDLIDGITVWRFSSGVLKDTGKIKRAINESLLSWRAWRATQSLVTKEKFDGIIYYSPSIFFGGLVSKIKDRWLCPSYLVLRDMFPQWVIDQGMISEKGVIARYFRHFEKKNYRAADCIGLMSKKNLNLFESSYSGIAKLEVLHNWADPGKVDFSGKGESIREVYDLNDKVIFFYGGNIGKAQDMSNLVRLAEVMQNYDRAHFLFVGQGDEVDLVKGAIAKSNRKNITYIPSVSQSAFRKILSEVDVGLFSLASSHTAHNFPGKILGYMVNGLPILGSVNPGNDLLDIINNKRAGEVYINGDDNSLRIAATTMLNDLSLRKKYGLAAMDLLRTQFSVDAAANSIISQLRYHAFKNCLSNRQLE